MTGRTIEAMAKTSARRGSAFQSKSARARGAEGSAGPERTAPGSRGRDVTRANGRWNAAPNGRAGRGGGPAMPDSGAKEGNSGLSAFLTSSVESMQRWARLRGKAQAWSPLKGWGKCCAVPKQGARSGGEQQGMHW